MSAGVEERIDWASTLPPRQKLVILGAVLVCLFLAALDQTIVATALPAIVSQFHAIDLLSWVSIGYLLSSTAMVPIYGRLSDLRGRRFVLLIGVVVFLAGSALSGLAGSMMQLILFRVLQGVGAAAITSTAFAVPADLYTPAERSKYMGFFGAAFGLASVIGPWLGGWLTDRLSWRWIFYVNLPLGAIAMVFIAGRMPRLAGGPRHPVDVRGTVLLVATVVPLMIGLSLDPRRTWHGLPLAPALLLVAAACAALFLWAERGVKAPVIPFELFRNRTYTTVTVASFLFGAAFFAAVLFLSIFMVNVVGVSATEAGEAIIPLTLGVVGGGLVSSFIVHHTQRYKTLIVLGLVVMTIGFVLAMQMGVNTSAAGVMWRMVVIGVGAGPGMPLLSLALQNAVPVDQVGTATAGRQFFTQIGQALGAAIFGMVLATSLSARLAHEVPPALAALPPPVQARLSPAQFRHSATGRGTGGVAGVVREQIRGAVVADLERLRGLARPAERGIFDQAEAYAMTQVEPVVARTTLAVRRSFAGAISRIYFGAIFVLIGAVVSVLLMPELKLRTSNRPEAFEALHD